MKINLLDFEEVVKDMFSDANEMFHINNYSYSKDEDGYVIKYIIPGASKEDISVKVDGEMLRIEVKKSDLFKGLKDSMWFPDDVSIEETTSKYKDGVLLIKMPSLKKVNDEEIEIEVE